MGEIRREDWGGLVGEWKGRGNHASGRRKKGGKGLPDMGREFGARIRGRNKLLPPSCWSEFWAAGLLTGSSLGL